MNLYLNISIHFECIFMNLYLNISFILISGCSVQIYKGGFFRGCIFDTHLPCSEALAYVLLHFNNLTMWSFVTSIAVIIVCPQQLPFKRLSVFIKFSSLTSFKGS